MSLDVSGVGEIYLQVWTVRILEFSDNFKSQVNLYPREDKRLSSTSLLPTRTQKPAGDTDEISMLGLVKLKAPVDTESEKQPREEEQQESKINV